MNTNLPFQKKAEYVDFFLSTYTENGYKSYFNEISNPFKQNRHFAIEPSFIGLSHSFLDKLYNEISEYTFLSEKIHCLKKPAFLESILSPDKKINISSSINSYNVETTIPLIINELIDFCPAFDNEQINKHRENIINCTFLIDSYNQKLKSALKMINSLYEENQKMILPYINTSKIKRKALSIAKKEIPYQEHTLGEVKSRFLTALTNNGLITYGSTISKLCQKIYILKDENNTCNHVFMDTIKTFALKQGHDIYCCYNPLCVENQLQHVLIPELGLGFVSQNYISSLESLVPYRIINCNNFIEKEILRNKKQHLDFNRQTAHNITQECVNLLEKQCSVYDELEQYYSSYIDFEKLQQIEDKYIFKIKKALLS